MRVLSALVLTHCFGCVIPEDSDDEFVPKPSSLRPISDASKEQISSETCPIVSSAYADDRRERYGREADSMFSMNDVQAVLGEGGASRYHDDAYDSFPEDAPEEGHVYLLPGRSSSVEKRDKSTQVNSNSWRNRRRGISHTKKSHQRSRKKRRKSHRNSVGHLKQDKRSHGKERQRSHRKHHRDREAHRAADGRRQIESGGDAQGWDEWTNWNECSVSCGCGRQVRWRHCTGGDCSKGLKKAQIKSCHLRDCNSRTLFNWLGIKT